METGVLTKKLLGIAIAAAGGCLLLAGSASAATVAIGSQFGAAPTSNPNYPGGVTLAAFAVPAPGVATSPVDGTVISWRFIGTGPGPITARILRPSGGVNYTAAGTGSAATPGGAGNIVGPIAASLPIKTGDLFAATVAATAPGSGISYRGPVLGASTAFFNEGFPDGTSDAAGFFDGEELALGAVVRYCLVPKLKGKSPKKARAALTAADCTVGKVKKTKKERKRKKVLSQAIPPGSSVSDTEPVDVKISRKR